MPTVCHALVRRSQSIANVANDTSGAIAVGIVGAILQVLYPSAQRLFFNVIGQANKAKTYW